MVLFQFRPCLIVPNKNNQMHINANWSERQKDEKCALFFKKKQFFKGYCENTALNVPFSNDIGRCLYFQKYVLTIA